MTLIITAATKDHIFQIADTRLTRSDGKFFDDNSVKTTIVHCYDAKLIISYTGLASINGERTDQWITRKLKNWKSWEKTFSEVVEFLRCELTKAAFYDKNLESIVLTLVIAALGINTMRERDFAMAKVTNCAKPRKMYCSFELLKPSREFQKYFFTTTDSFRWYLEVDGAVCITKEINALRRNIAKKLPQIKTNEQLIEMMKHLVAWLRLQRKNKEIGHLIAEDCIGVHIGSDFRSLSFSFIKDNKLKMLPNIVSKDK